MMGLNDNRIIEISNPADDKSHEHPDELYRLKKDLAASRSRVLLHAQEIDCFRQQLGERDKQLNVAVAQLHKFEMENQTLRQSADRWVEFQGSRFFRAHRAYSNLHEVAVIGCLLKAIKWPFLIVFCRKP